MTARSPRALQRSSETQYVRASAKKFGRTGKHRSQLRQDSRGRRRGPGRFRTEGPRRIALRARRPGKLALAGQLLDSLFLVFGARQRREESNEAIDIALRQGARLDVLVEIRILQAVALVVVIDDIPKRLLRAVVKVGSRHKHVANIWRLEGRDIGFLLG